MPFCSTCSGHYFVDRPHRCPQAWDVWRLDDDVVDARRVHAIGADAAAERWAEREDWDSAEYSILCGEVVAIAVREVGSDDVRYFTVSGESVPSYSAEEVEPPAGDDAGRAA